MRRSYLVAGVVVFAVVSAAVFMSCGGGGGTGSAASTTGTFEVVAVTSGTQIPAKVSAAPRMASAATGTTTGCDGPTSVCCNAGSDCSPTTVSYKTYKVWLSTSPTCSPGILVDDKGAGLLSTVTAGSVRGATLFSGGVPAGTYHCMIMKIDDAIAFVPNQTARDTFSACSSGATATIDILKSGDPAWVNYETGGSIVGAGIPGTPSTQQVYSLMTTSTAQVPGSVAHANQVEQLAAPIIVPAARTVTVYIDSGFTNNVVMWDEPVTDFCWMIPGVTSITVK